MRDLSLHILDIMQNSIRAEATEIELIIEENIANNKFIIQIIDNGRGMDEQVRKNITNPFTTTRTLRKVGLGVAFLKQICDECTGNLKIESEKGKGTKVVATMQHNHIDRLPLGEISKSITALIMAKPSIHYVYTHRYNERTFRFDTKEIEDILDGVEINNLEIIKWIEEYIEKNLEKLMY